MLFDALSTYSDGQVLTDSARSSNTIDHVTPRASGFGSGEPLCVLIVLTEAADDANADETYTVKVQTDDNEEFTTPTDLTPEMSIPRGSVAGSNFFLPIPQGKPTERFSSLYFTLGGDSPSVTVKAALFPVSMISRNAQVLYPIGVEVA